MPAESGGTGLRPDRILAVAHVALACQMWTSFALWGTSVSPKKLSFPHGRIRGPTRPVKIPFSKTPFCGATRFEKPFSPLHADRNAQNRAATSPVPPYRHRANSRDPSPRPPGAPPAVWGHAEPFRLCVWPSVNSPLRQKSTCTLPPVGRKPPPSCGVGRQLRTLWLRATARTHRSLSAGRLAPSSGARVGPARRPLRFFFWPVCSLFRCPPSQKKEK